MRDAIGLELDFEAGAAYIAYGRLPEGELIAHVTRISDDVVVQYDAQGAVAGIELIQIVTSAVAVAEEFAAQNDLVFPPLRSFIRYTTSNLNRAV
jgi:uncharacterized protein YuzE